MQWHEFVFSEKKGKRILRHLVFWLAWWLYFFYCDYLFQQPLRGLRANPVYVTTGGHILLKTSMMILVYAAAGYAFLHFILSRGIKGRWQKLIWYFTLPGLCLFGAGYLLFWYGFPIVDSLFGPYAPNHFSTWFWPAVYLGWVNPVKIVAAAGIIKYVKYWWLKQKESERLEREKIETELQLLKAQVHPDFLLNTLHSIYEQALSSSPGAPAMLLKLSDLLSYMLYECEDWQVPLEKEISMMKQYVDLEKLRQDGIPEVEITVKGDVKDKQIAPFLLFPFLGNSFNLCRLTDQPWINMDIKIEDDLFSMKLANGLPASMKEQAYTVAIENVQKRLALLYPGKHSLKITSEQEMQIVILNMQLKNGLFMYPEAFEAPPVTKQKDTAVLNYVSE